MEDSAEVSGIHLVVPDPRTAAMLLVEVRSPDGKPRKGATVSLSSLDGVPGRAVHRESVGSERFFGYCGEAQVQIIRDGVRPVIHLVQKLVEKQ